MLDPHAPLSSSDLSLKEAPSVADRFVAALLALGIREAFGVMGGAIAPFFRALTQGGVRAIHCRHEAGAAFAAVEASLATGRAVLVFTTAGPGLSNALTGMLAARWDGAHVLFVSACTSAAHRGRVATQETSAATMPSAGFMLPGAPLHYAATLEHPAQLAAVLTQLANGLQRPGGFVAHVSLPIAVQNDRALALPPLAALPRHAAPPPLAAVEEHAALLRAGSFVVWVGHGARHAAEALRALVERTGARVLCSPRAKGVFPEDHPQFLGVTGVGGHAEVDEALTRERPAYTLVLGTRMGEATSFWSPELTPSRAFLHVDVDPTAFGAAYPDVPTRGVVADVGQYLQALLAALPADTARAPTGGQRPRPTLPLRAEGKVRPQALLAEIQRTFVDEGDAWVMAESGNSFCWANHLLRFAHPGRYRVSPGFGSMGHAATGVVGAALARGGKAVALVGDGAMVMLNEVHTAVQYNADAVWIVLNDACYLMCAQGMSALGWTPFSCDMPRVDFVAYARSLGADGAHVRSEGELRAVLSRAARHRGPFVVDVDCDPRELPPSGKRNRSLLQQGFGAKPTGR